MPTLLVARLPADDTEERQGRTLAARRQALGAWLPRARMMARSWEGLRPTAIAAARGGHPPPVRARIAPCTVAGRSRAGGTGRRGCGMARR
jgi:hypothetical protein